MSPMVLLLVLLVLAYIGSLWASGEQKRAFGSPSGVEFVVLGLLLGPEALGVLGHEAMAELEPIAIVALGWIGLGFGLECGLVGERRARTGRLALGLLFTVLTALLAAWAAFALIGFFRLAAGDARWTMSAAIGLVSAETTRHAVRWVGHRQSAGAPLSTLLLELAAADDAPVLLALAFLFAALTGPRTLHGVLLSAPAMAALTLAIGCSLGALAAWLLRFAGSTVERWTILLGAAWLATGVARSIGLAALSATFMLGLTLSALSTHAPRLRARIGQTEGAVLLPALLLAGAHLEPPRGEAEIALIGAALGVRVAVSLALGFLLARVQPETRGLGLWLGVGMLASGTLTIIVAFGMTLRCPPELARPALAIAFIGTLLGEVVGPAALRRAFGELGGTGTERDAAASAPRPAHGDGAP